MSSLNIKNDSNKTGVIDNNNSNNNNISIYDNSNKTLNKNMFQFNYVIGKGGFGKVWQVVYKKTKQPFALKEMSKRKILDKKSEKSINNEMLLLKKLYHPFIVNMHYAFQDNDNLYLVIDFLSGGDLRFHCSRYRTFSEEQTRFFISCIILGLEHIHQNNVIHRDIKPENLVLDKKGYLCITDFGIARINKKDNSSETSGTPGYMSPEVMRGCNHTFSVDFFAIGVIGYEFMLGKRPYNGKDRKEIKEEMFGKKIKLKKSDLQKGWSIESIDFINQLLERKPELRLGNKNGVIDLKEHLWLKYYPWKELANKELPAPFIPDKNDNYDKRYCESAEVLTEETKTRYKNIYQSFRYRNAFRNFYFNIETEKRVDKNIEKKEEEKKEEEKKEEEKKEEGKIINKETKSDFDTQNNNNKLKNNINNEKINNEIIYDKKINNDKINNDIINNDNINNNINNDNINNNINDNINNNNINNNLINSLPDGEINDKKEENNEQKIDENKENEKKEDNI